MDKNLEELGAAIEPCTVQGRTTFIEHPYDGREWDAQCARCGSSLDWHQCEACDGDGITGPGELYEQDPLWYDPADFDTCHQCNGESSWPYCLSSPDWCETNPLKGRETIKSGTPEWFVIFDRARKGRAT